MRFHATDIAGVLRIELEPLRDERGSFARAYCEAEFATHGLAPVGVQCNVSYNRRRGTLRGLHYQIDPSAEAKLVRCTAGRIYDVAVDLRPTSPTYRRWVAAELDAARSDMLYIAAGCAHGFITLSDDATVFYQMGAAYRPELARGVRWNDPALAVAWPLTPICISERDASYPDLAP